MEKDEKPSCKLIGEDGNAFAILSRVSQTLKKADQPEKAKEFLTEATQGDYNHLLVTATKYVDVY